MEMGKVAQGLAAYAAQPMKRESSAAEGTSGTKETDAAKSAYRSGRTVGDTKLTKEAAAYLDDLKKRYGDMDFVLVSKDQVEATKKNIGAYASPNKQVVLIDEEKVERMATDEEYRKRYEGIIANSRGQLAQMSKELSQAGIQTSSFGISVSDNGASSFFATVDKDMSEQRDRIMERREKKKAEKKAADKKAEKKAAEQKIADKRAEKKAAEKAEGKKAEKEAAEEKLKKRPEEEVTVTAGSMEDLLSNIRSQQMGWLSDNLQTEQERLVGGHIDFRG